MTVRVKICGITCREDALAAVEAGADALGLNFWTGSRRCVGPGTAREIVSAVPPGILTVGVFVNAGRDAILELLGEVPLGAVQLHGDEPPEECGDLPVPVVKALRASPGVAERAARYATRWILLDADVAGRWGGTGETFPWERAEGIDRGRLFLAGGLRPENVAEAVRRVRPWAVDVAGGVESAPGRKDAARMKELVTNAKTA